MILSKTSDNLTNTSGTTIKRRQLLKGLSATLGVLSLRGFSVHAAASTHFTHSVASGDPLADRVILWTRMIPGGGEHRQLSCHWEVATDPAFSNIVVAGDVTTSADRDYTVKVDASGLKPATRYYYRFTSAGVSSPTGRTKTLPRGPVKEFRMGVTSCANYPQGYFHGYRHMAESELDLVVHLGDYIYEYAEGVYADEVALEQLGRHVKPTTETISLDDYRTRYGLYRSDADLQALHLRQPFICVWDDHELANNTWQNGAENHSEDEGEFLLRMAQARKAYHEWMPIRETGDGVQAPIYRSFKIGDLADLIMLDTRLHGREKGLVYSEDLPMRSAFYRVDPAGQGSLIDEATADTLPADEVVRLPVPFDFSSGKPVAVTDYNRIASLTPETMPPHWHLLPDTDRFTAEQLNIESRSILGDDQEAWLAEALQSSKSRGATWQILGQQVLMGKVGVPTLSEEAIQVDDPSPELKSLLALMKVLAAAEMPLNLDAWDGYPGARDRVFEQLQKSAANPVVLAGDTHNAWAFNLADANGQAIGIEIGTPGITSPGMEGFIPADPAELAQALRACSPEIYDLDTSRRGWSKVIFTPQAVTNQWFFVDNILDQEYTISSSEIMQCKAGDRKFS